jgi:hypothetical protein
MYHHIACLVVKRGSNTLIDEIDVKLGPGSENFPSDGDKVTGPQTIDVFVRERRFKIQRRHGVSLIIS